MRKVMRDRVARRFVAMSRAEQIALAMAIYRYLKEQFGSISALARAMKTDLSDEVQTPFGNFRWGEILGLLILAKEAKEGGWYELDQRN